MIKKTRLLKHFLLLFALIAGSTSVWAEEKSVDITPAQALNEGGVSPIAIVCAKGDGTSAPAISSGQLRLYQAASGKTTGNTITFSSEKTITKIVFTFANDMTADNGSFSVGSYDSSTFTWTGSTNSVTLTVTGTTSGKRIYITAMTVYYEDNGNIPPTTTYTVTYDCNGGTSGCPEDVTGITAGTSINLADAPTKTGNTFGGWSDGSTTYQVGASYEVNSNVTFTAQWTPTGGGETGGESWVETSLADLTEDDVFVIVGNNGSNYAMSNDNGTSSGPSAVAVTISGGKITSTVADNIKWNISGNATDGYTFYPNGDSEKWLYCTNTNNGVRVGANSDNTFVISDGYLFHNGTSRYVGIYSDNSVAKDWRCYTSINANIKNQTFAFYKKVTGDVTVPSITASNVEIEYDATGGAISYTINNPVDGGTVSAAINEGDWITLGQGTTSPIPFTCSANETTTARTATVTLTYTYATDKTVTKDVTVTQAAAPVVYSTIPALFDAATSTETNVNVTFGGWVVSGVNGSTAYVTDNEGNGFIIYKSSHGFNVNDKLSGTVTGTPLKLYKGAAEFTNLTASTTGLTVTNDGVITVVTDKTIADLGGVNTGAVFTLSNLTYDGTNLSDGTNNTIQPYNTLYAGTFEANKTYNVTGVYLQYDSKKEILPRSADDIVEVVSTEPQIVVEATTINLAYNATSGEIPFTIVNPVENASFGAGTFDTPWINVNAVKIDATHYKVTFTTEANTGEERSATITINYNGVTKDVTVTQAAYVAPADGYYVKVTSTDDLTDGQYLIVYEEGSVAFDGGLTTLDAVGNTIEVVIDDDEIAATSATRAAEFTIDVTAGTLQSASGKYIGVSTNSNGLKTSDVAGTYTNAFSIDDNENAVIAAVFEESSMTLRFNSASNQNRFRYYSSGQKDIQLYKFVSSNTVTASVSQYKWATFSSEYDLDFTDVTALEAHIVTGANGSTIVTEKVEGTVAAGTGLLLYSETPVKNVEIPIAEEAGVNYSNMNKLIAVTEDNTVIEKANDGTTNYVLAVQNEKAVFAYIDGVSATLGKGKAYLHLDGAPAAPYLSFEGGETTGIGNVNRETITNNQYYTLDGRRVENPSNGVYIVNGKKVVIK